jgi:hypothetical protein
VQEIDEAGALLMNTPPGLGVLNRSRFRPTDGTVYFDWAAGPTPPSWWQRLVAKIRAVWATRPWAPLARAELQERMEMDAPAVRFEGRFVEMAPPPRTITLGTRPTFDGVADFLPERVVGYREWLDRQHRWHPDATATRTAPAEPPALADEVEAWTEVLEYLRAGAVFVEGGYFGLCGLVSAMCWEEEIIDETTREAMKERIKRALPQGREWLAPEGDARARIPIVQRFLRDAIAERAAAERAP